MTFVPLISEQNFSLEFFFHVTSMLPLLFSVLISRMYGGKLSKTLYLCPLSKEQVREYMKKGMILRIVISVVIFLLFNMASLILGYMPLWIFLTKLFLMTCSAICFNIYCQPDNKTSSAMERTYPLIGNYEVRNVFAQVFAAIGMLILSLVEGNEQTWEYVLIAIIPILQLFLCINVYKRFYHQIINLAEFYE